MAFVQHKSGTSGNSNAVALSFDGNVVAGSTLVIIVQIEDAGAGVTISSISGNSNTYDVTAESPIRGGSQNGTQWMYYVKVANSGATTVTVNFSATGYPKLSMYELSGRDATAPLVDSNAAQGTSGVPDSGTLVCGADSCDLIVGCQTGVGTPTEGTGYTLNEASSPYWYGASQSKYAQTGNQSSAFAGPSGGDWVSISGAFKASGGGGGATVTKGRRTLLGVGV